MEFWDFWYWIWILKLRNSVALDWIRYFLYASGYSGSMISGEMESFLINVTNPFKYSRRPIQSPLAISAEPAMH